MERLVLSNKTNWIVLWWYLKFFSCFSWENIFAIFKNVSFLKVIYFKTFEQMPLKIINYWKKNFIVFGQWIQIQLYLRLVLIYGPLPMTIKNLQSFFQCSNYSPIPFWLTIREETWGFYWVLLDFSILYPSNYGLGQSIS